MKIIKIIIIILIGIVLSFNLYKKIEFKNSKKEENLIFSNNSDKKILTIADIKAEISKDYNEGHKKEIKKKWDQLEVRNEKVWIEYSNNYNRKTKVDFEKKEISVELLLDKNTNPQGIAKSLTHSIYTILLRTTNEASDSVNPDKYNVVEAPQVDYIVGDIFDIESKGEALYRSQQIFGNSKVSSRKAKDKNKIIVKALFLFPENGISKKAQKYHSTMIKHAKKNDLPVKLIYAITKVESHFNPMAKSRVPAYGLMQIVPHTSGKDITKKLEGKERILSPKELYNGYKNIEYGAIYLNIIFHSYLKHIEDDTSRIYCTIAAYNTGVGHVAQTFTGSYGIKSASIIINKMSSEEVYNKLINDLPYIETRYYLKRTRGFLYEFE
jgi:membrane-bound lytic murein transglycosylase C